MSKTYRIQKEDDAWEVLELWLKKESIAAIEFDGWPRLDISIEGDDYKSSLSTKQMSAFIDFKMVMGRAYAAIAHGAYDARRLKTAEEEQLELTTTVKEGSSITETDFTALVNAFAQIVSANPGISLAASIVLGLLFVSRPLIRQHLENKAKQIDSDERKKLISLVEKNSDEDRRRLKLMDDAIKKISQTYPQFGLVLPAAAAAHWRLTGSAANADRMVVSGVELSQEQLEVLAERRAYRDAEIETIEDVFQVLGVIRVHKNYRIQLRSKRMVLSAMYQAPEMTDAKVRRLVSCITSLQLIKATLALKTIENAHVTGRLLSYEPLPNVFGEAQES